MVTKELLNYIKQQIEEEVEKDVIKTKLINNGWQDSDVEEAFNLIPPVSAAGEAPQSINQPSANPAYQIIGSDLGKKQPFTYPPIRSSKKKLIIAILGIILVVSGVASQAYSSTPASTGFRK